MSNASSTATAVACSASAATTAVANVAATAATTYTYTLVGDVTYRFYFGAETPRTLKVFKGELPVL